MPMACSAVLHGTYAVVHPVRWNDAVFVPAAVVVLTQPQLLRLAVDAHVQQRHALREREVELEAGRLRQSLGRLRPRLRQSGRVVRPRRGRHARGVADDVPRLGRVDVSLDHAARRPVLGQLGDGVAHGRRRVVEPLAVRRGQDRPRRRRRRRAERRPAPAAAAAGAVVVEVRRNTCPTLSHVTVHLQVCSVRSQRCRTCSCMPFIRRRAGKKLKRMQQHLGCSVL